jgi:DNA-binding Xre family transcriptional regulator
VSEFRELSRSKLRDHPGSFALPLTDGLLGDPKKARKGSGGLKVRNGGANQHSRSLIKMNTGVNDRHTLDEERSPYHPLMETMGDRMKALRLSRGLTQEEVAKIMGITGPALSMIENGVNKNVRLDNFLRFCAYFEADPYYVVFGQGKAAATGRYKKLATPET